MPFAWVGAGAAVISAGTSVAGALKSGADQSGAISAGQAQANARVQPWVDTGTGANTQQADLLGLNGQPAADTAMKSFQSSPGYQYQVSEGLRGVDAGAAARGTLVSGSTIKGEETLSSNLANQDFGAYMTRLNSLSTLGQNSAVGQAGTDTGAAANQAKIAGNTDNAVTNSLSSFAGNKDVQNGLTSLFGGSSTGASSAFGSGQNYTAPASLVGDSGLHVGGT